MPILGLPEKEERKPKKELPVKESPAGIDKSSPYYVELPELLDLEEIIELAKRKEEQVSVLEATRLLRAQRPDLRDEPLICVRLIKEDAVCLDLTRDQTSEMNP